MENFGLNLWEKLFRVSIKCPADIFRVFATTPIQKTLFHATFAESAGMNIKAFSEVCLNEWFKGLGRVQIYQRGDATHRGLIFDIE